jgi:fatty acid desaturase
MTAAEPSAGKIHALIDSELKEKLQELRQTDNYTNFFYLARAYLFLAVVIGGTLWFYYWQITAGVSFWWNVPVTLVAILLIGAGQHQLSGLTHEAAHHILFRNRYLNDLISDWFCSFPLFSTTHHYRLQHLAHHQFVNDPLRDPDLAQMQASGHWLDFPITGAQFFRTLLKQAWLPNLVRYMRIRGRYAAMPDVNNPYRRKDWQPSQVLVRVGIAYMLGLIGLLAALVWLGNPVLLAVLPTVCWLGILVFYALVPERLYSQHRIHPVISTRHMTLMRMTFISALFSGLAWITLLTGAWAAAYFFLLWIVPIFTSFSFLMMLRQLVQHGNGGRGWLTNTRIFLVNQMIKFSVFPIGQDYHLPHHLFATVPHYRLRRLHEILLANPEYRKEAVVVEGYFLHREEPPVRPTVVDVLGPAYAPPDSQEAYIDDTVLEGERVEEKEEILRAGRSSS